MSTPTGPHDDDVDARFRRIIDAEFGQPDDLPPTPRQRPGAATPTTPGTTGEPFNLARALDEAVPDAPDEPFEPPVAEPVRLPSGRAGAGLALVTAAMAVWVLTSLTDRLPPWTGVAAALAFAAGLAVLLSSLPRAGRDPWDDGTRV